MGPRHGRNRFTVGRLQPPHDSVFKKKKKELCGEAKGRERCLRETRMQYTLNV